jgi:hypothetical protein
VLERDGLQAARQSRGREFAQELADRLADRQQAGVGQVADVLRLRPRVADRVGRRRRAVDQDAPRPRQEVAVVGQLRRLAEPVGPVVERDVGREADRHLVLQVRARPARVAQHHELAAARVARGLAERALAVDLRAHLGDPRVVVEGAEDDDAARVAPREPDGRLKLVHRIGGVGVEPEVQHEIDLDRLRVLARRGGLPVRGRARPHLRKAPRDRADGGLDPGKRLENARHGPGSGPQGWRQTWPLSERSLSAPSGPQDPAA